jgi:hypothetical protein
MIRPEQRVSKPARKSSRDIAAAMRKRRRRAGSPQEQRYSDEWNVVPLFRKIAIRIRSRSVKIAQ